MPDDKEEKARIMGIIDKLKDKITDLKNGAGKITLEELESRVMKELPNSMKQILNRLKEKTYDDSQN